MYYLCYLSVRFSLCLVFQTIITQAVMIDCMLGEGKFVGSGMKKGGVAAGKSDNTSQVGRGPSSLLGDTRHIVSTDRGGGPAKGRGGLDGREEKGELVGCGRLGWV